MPTPKSLRLWLALSLVLGAALEAAAAGPTILAVTAHPDDDALFAATNYRITHSLGGKVDLAVVTNGEGGYKYSDLSKPIYGLDLTDEKTAREFLPGIRKRELMAGGAIIGIRNYFFLDQKDQEYTVDLEAGLKPWDVEFVKARLEALLRQGHYDYVLVMLPVPTTHAHHQGAALLALEAVARLPEGERPIVLGAGGYKKGTTERVTFTGRPEYPLTRVKPGAPVFEFDRTQKLGSNDRLDYNIVVNWLIAEHKSQGTMQLLMNALDVEQFWYFDLNPESGIARTRELFERLKAP